MNILIVEDNRHMRRMLMEIVRSAYGAATVHEAEDANTAFVLCRETRPDLVLMDVGLPDANGIDLTTSIKGLLPNSRILIVSNHRSRVYMDAARMAGADDYIAKDEVHEKLLPAVTVALAQIQCGPGASE